jgi:hypothetical protein
MIKGQTGFYRLSRADLLDGISRINMIINYQENRRE